MAKIIGDNERIKRKEMRHIGERKKRYLIKIEEQGREFG
jgi:hypothetical protein